MSDNRLQEDIIDCRQARMPEPNWQQTKCYIWMLECWSRIWDKKWYTNLMFCKVKVARTQSGIVLYCKWDLCLTSCSFTTDNIMKGFQTAKLWSFVQQKIIRVFHIQNSSMPSKCAAKSHVTTNLDLATSQDKNEWSMLVSKLSCM